jgi:hypothetical protein
MCSKVEAKIKFAFILNFNQFKINDSKTKGFKSEFCLNANIFIIWTRLNCVVDLNDVENESSADHAEAGDEEGDEDLHGDGGDALLGLAVVLVVLLHVVLRWRFFPPRIVQQLHVFVAGQLQLGRAAQLILGSRPVQQGHFLAFPVAATSFIPTLGRHRIAPLVCTPEIRYKISQIKYNQVIFGFSC